jgi:hypothetical protein
MSISGYLSIYNDWDILEHALRSVVPYIDELVVVDGGYRWMSAYLTAIGRDLERSVDRVYDIVGSFPVPTKVVSGPWDDEPQKRIAGYDACSCEFVLRFDADDVGTASAARPHLTLAAAQTGPWSVACCDGA